MKFIFVIFLTCWAFKSHSQVRPAVVAVEKQNILYIGIDNPISIAIPGYACTQTYATTNNGTLAGNGCRYTARPKNLGESLISVYSITSNDTIIDSILVSITDTILAGKYLFRAKDQPDPVVKVSGKRNEAISKGVLMVQKGPYAELENFDIDIKYKITSFWVRHYSSNKQIKEVYNEGTLFNEETKEMFNFSFKGDIFRIFKVIAKTPDGREIELEPMELYVVEKF